MRLGRRDRGTEKEGEKEGGNKRATKKEINNAKGTDSSHFIHRKSRRRVYRAPNEKIAVSFDLLLRFFPFPLFLPIEGRRIRPVRIPDFVPASNDRVYVSTFSSRKIVRFNGKGNNAELCSNESKEAHYDAALDESTVE